MDRYVKIEKNGECGAGTYGVVYKGRDQKTNEIVALKATKLSNEDPPIRSFLNLCYTHNREFAWRWKMKVSLLPLSERFLFSDS